jgi:hypothetical protein
MAKRQGWQGRRGVCAGAACAGALLACAGAARAQEPDVAALEDQLQAAMNLRGASVVKVQVGRDLGVPIQVAVPFAGQVYTLDLRPHSVRDESYTLWEQQADGNWLQRDPGPVNTLRGEVIGLPGSIVAGGLTDEGLLCRVILPDQTEFWLEPIAGRIQGAQPDSYVVYTVNNLVAADWRCANTEMPVDPDLGDSEGGPLPRGLTLYTAQLACDSDWEFFQRYGGTSNVQSRIAAVINTMNVQYERDVNIVHVITTTLTRSSAAADPYTTTDPATLNAQIETEWNGIAGTRDVIQLFTETNIDGSVIGRANHIGAICTAGGDPNCFAWSNFNNNFMSATDLSAHELGHLWDAVHCACSSPASTMNPSITSINRFTFSNDQNNISQITSYRNSVSGCLTTSLTGLNPRNDNCSEAVPISTGRFGFSNTGANTDGPAVTDCGTGNLIMEDVWYTFQPQCDGTLTVSTCNTASETGFDTVLVLYTGGCTSLNQVACNDDAGALCAVSGLRSRLTFSCTAQTVYRLRVGGYNGASGSGILDVDYTTCPELPNDTCAGAITISHCDSPISFNTENADSEGFIEQNDCNFFGHSQIFNDIWYRVVAPCTGTYRVSTCGATFDSKIAIYTSCPAGINSALACNDDDGPACTGTRASVDFFAVSGADYYIRLGAYSQTGFGTGNLTLTPLACPVPVNDDCVDAIVVGTGSTAFNTANACDSDTTSNNCANDGGNIPRDIWFRWTAPDCAGPTTIDLCDASYDSKVAVYLGCPLADNTAIACNDDACGAGGLASRLTFNATSGFTYRIRIGGYLGQTGSGNMIISVAPPAPSNDDCASGIVVGNGITGVTNCGATLDGPTTGCRPGYSDVWYIYQATCTGNVTVDTCAAATFDTVLFAYNTTGGCPAQQAQQVACNDDACGPNGLNSRITFPAMAGERFRIRLASFSSTDEGTAIMTISCQSACPCDFNRDGVLNSQDYFDFLTCFFGGGCPSGQDADYNDDTVVNSQDYFDFLTCFFGPPASCP